MIPAFRHAVFDARFQWERFALAVWCAVIVFVCVRVYLEPGEKTVYPIFSAAGRLWWHGAELYEPYRQMEALDGFRYPPTFAALIAPLAFLPDQLGGVFWRLLNVAALLGGVACFARSVLPPPSTRRHAWLMLLIVPLSLHSINNGQVNPIIIGAMLGAVAAVHEERWNLASMLLAGAGIIKLYPLALGLLLVVLYPRQLGWRLCAALAAWMCLPFALQQPIYVVDQYAKWLALLRADDRSDTLLAHMYRDLWLLIHLYGLPVSRTAYAVLQVGAGAAIAVLCWRRQRTGWPRAALLVSTLALACTWMMLLGPATESSTFILLAPSLAWSMVDEWNTPSFRTRGGLLWMSCACFLAAVVLGTFRSTVAAHAMGVHSWGSLCYFAYLWLETDRWQRNPAEARCPPAALGG